MGALSKCSFQLQREEPRDYESVLKAIGDSISLKGVRHLDLSRPQLGVVTFNSEAECARLVKTGFTYNDVKLSVRHFDIDAVVVRVTGCWYELDDAVICTAVSQFGKILRGPDRESITLDGCNVETDTRTLTCILSKALPPSFVIGNKRVRVSHRGQPKTCFRCSQEGHIAKECPVIATAAQNLGKLAPNLETNSTMTKKNTDQKSDGLKSFADTARTGSASTARSASPVPTVSNSNGSETVSVSGSRGQKSKTQSSHSNATSAASRARSSTGSGAATKTSHSAGAGTTTPARTASSRTPTSNASSSTQQPNAPTTGLFYGKRARASPEDVADGFRAPEKRATRRPPSVQAQSSPALSQRFAPLDETAAEQDRESASANISRPEGAHPPDNSLGKTTELDEVGIHLKRIREEGNRRSSF